MPFLLFICCQFNSQTPPPPVSEHKMVWDKFFIPYTSYMTLERLYNICGVYPLPTYNTSEIILIRANLGYSNEQTRVVSRKSLYLGVYNTISATK